MKRLVESLATGFYVGKIRYMPGTFGTLWGIPVAWAFLSIGPRAHMLLTIALLIFAAVISELYERRVHTHDSSEIVIDEVVGFVIAMTWLPLTWQAFLAAFLLFRLFDIWKPYPIRAIDQKIGGGLGTVLDDVAAGLVANIILQLIHMQTTWLGGGANV